MMAKERGQGGQFDERDSDHEYEADNWQNVKNFYNYMEVGHTIHICSKSDAKTTKFG